MGIQYSKLKGVLIFTCHVIIHVVTKQPSLIKRPLSSIDEANCKTPPLKKHLPKDETMVKMKAMRLPNPCPLPTAFSPAVHFSILQNDISGNCKLKMLRESASFFYGICPFPNPSEYLEMAKALCNKYPLLQDTHCSNAAYWVWYTCTCIIIMLIHLLYRVQ